MKKKWKVKCKKQWNTETKRYFKRRLIREWEVERELPFDFLNDMILLDKNDVKLF